MIENCCEPIKYENSFSTRNPNIVLSDGRDRTMSLFESLPWPIERAEQYEIPLIFIFEYNDDYSSYGDRGRDRKLTRIHQESTRAGEKGPK